MLTSWLITLGKISLIVPSVAIKCILDVSFIPSTYWSVLHLIQDCVSIDKSVYLTLHVSLICALCLDSSSSCPTSVSSIYALEDSFIYSVSFVHLIIQSFFIELKRLSLDLSTTSTITF